MLPKTKMALVGLFFASASAHAEIGPPPFMGYDGSYFNFSCFTDTCDAYTDVGGQLVLQVLREVSDVNGDGLDPLTYFKFWNVVGEPSSVTQVAIDWGDDALTDLSYVKNGPTFGTNFVEGGGPPILPGGTTIGFETDAVLNARPTQAIPQGKVGAGINFYDGTSKDVFELSSTTSYAEVIARMTGSAPTLRFGLHVQALECPGFPGDCDGSNSYINLTTPVPEPGAMALTLAGLGFVTFVARRRLRTWG
jgi:hypothetical protein